MTTEGKLCCQICGKYVVRLKRHLFSLHPTVTKSVLAQMLVNYRKNRSDTKHQGHLTKQTAYVQCSAKSGTEECRKLIKENE